MESASGYTAFEAGRLVARGSLPDVVLKLKRRMGKADQGASLIFSDATGNVLDFDFHGTEKDVLRRLEVFVPEAAPDREGPGRPRLGVVSREVSLLPRHWEWLASQSGGASAALRRLVEEARKKASEGASIKQLQERAYKFLSVMAGNLEGYEEAIRALYRRDAKAFSARLEAWPPDIKAHASELAQPVFAAAPKRPD